MKNDGIALRQPQKTYNNSRNVNRDLQLQDGFYFEHPVDLHSSCSLQDERR